MTAENVTENTGAEDAGANDAVTTGPAAPLERVQLRSVLSSPAETTRVAVRPTARRGLV